MRRYEYLYYCEMRISPAGMRHLVDLRRRLSRHPLLLQKPLLPQVFLRISFMEVSCDNH